MFRDMTFVNKYRYYRRCHRPAGCDPVRRRPVSRSPAYGGADRVLVGAAAALVRSRKPWLPRRSSARARFSGLPPRKARSGPACVTSSMSSSSVGGGASRPPPAARALRRPEECPEGHASVMQFPCCELGERLRWPASERPRDMIRRGCGPQEWETQRKWSAQWLGRLKALYWTTQGT